MSADGPQVGGSRPRIGLFGGTFDPIHVGHLVVAEAARETLGLDVVVFMPAGRPPHKPGVRMSSAQDRALMVLAAIEGNPGFEMSSLELERGGPSYTVDTVEALVVAWDLEPGELALILSSEAAAELATWHRPERVLELVTLLLVPRGGYPDLDAAVIADLVPAAADPRVVVVDGPQLRLSASEIRRRAAAGQSIRYLVPDAVREHIGDHALYRDLDRA